MALSELQQAKKLIERSRHILLIVPERASYDAISSMIAMFLALQHTKEDHVDEVSSSHVPSILQFLPGSSQVLMSPKRQPEIVIDITGPETIASTRTEKLQSGLRVHLSLPAETEVEKDKIEFSVRLLPYDVVVIFGASDLEKLGPTFAHYTDFFYNTPIINIDHRADNEHFGTVNLVDITAGSIAEVTYSLISTFLPDPLDADTATALYAGLVAGTQSFQRPSTTPQSFQMAARLISMEADREAVIQHLVKTKPLKLLKLAGRLYARLRYNEDQQVYWTMMRAADFRDSGASQADLPAAVREIINNVAGFNLLMVVSESSDQRYEIYIVLGKGLMSRRDEIQSSLSARRDNGLMYVTLGAPSLEEAEQKALDLVKSILP